MSEMERVKLKISMSISRGFSELPCLFSFCRRSLTRESSPKSIKHNTTAEAYIENVVKLNNFNDFI